ncbi:MAG: hypothetical protein AB3N14_01325 [Flavobacteriaceae bacterium]
MKNSALKTFLLMIAVLSLTSINYSCSSDGEDGVESCSLDGPNFSISDVAGSWTATTATFSILNNPNNRDIIAEGGSVSLSVQGSGRFSLTIMEGDGTTQNFSGNLGFCDDGFNVAYDDAPDDPEIYTTSFNGTEFTLLGDTEFDVDADGTEDAAIVRLIFVRN